jgi:hypothetical protein
VAQSTSVVGRLTYQVAAQSDLSAHQFKAVIPTAAGPLLADARSCGPGHPYILANKPTSGQAAALVMPPDVSKAVAGGAITAGQWAGVMSASPVNGLFIATSFGDPGGIGVCMTTVAGSGTVFDLHVLR